MIRSIKNILNISPKDPGPAAVFEGPNFPSKNAAFSNFVYWACQLVEHKTASLKCPAKIFMHVGDANANIEQHLHHSHLSANNLQSYENGFLTFVLYSAAQPAKWLARLDSRVIKRAHENPRACHWGATKPDLEHGNPGDDPKIPASWQVEAAFQVSDQRPIGENIPKDVLVLFFSCLMVAARLCGIEKICFLAQNQHEMDTILPVFGDRQSDVQRAWHKTQRPWPGIAKDDHKLIVTHELEANWLKLHAPGFVQLPSAVLPKSVLKQLITNPQPQLPKNQKTLQCVKVANMLYWAARRLQEQKWPEINASVKVEMISPRDRHFTGLVDTLSYGVVLAERWRTGLLESTVLFEIVHDGKIVGSLKSRLCPRATEDIASFTRSCHWAYGALSPTDNICNVAVGTHPKYRFKTEFELKIDGVEHSGPSRQITPVIEAILSFLNLMSYELDSSELVCLCPRSYSRLYEELGFQMKPAWWKPPRAHVIDGHMGARTDGGLTLYGTKKLVGDPGRDEESKLLQQ